MQENKIKTLFVLFFILFCIVSIGAVGAADNNITTNLTTNGINTSTSGLASSPWPTYQGNSQHTGVSNYTGPTTNKTKFMYNLTTGSQAAIGPNGIIYVAGSSDGILYAFNSDGKLKWKYQTASSLLGSPTVGSDGTVYVSTWKNSTLYAFQSNGTVKWKYNMGSYNFGSSPVISDDGTIYIPVTNGNLYAIQPNGTLKWIYNIGELYGTSPAIGLDGTIYISNYIGILYALNPNGAMKWTFDLSRYQDRRIAYTYNTAPTIGSDGNIYVTVTAGMLTVITPNGYRLWDVTPNGTTGVGGNIGEILYGSPITKDRTVYLVGKNTIYAVHHTISVKGVVLYKFTVGNVDTSTLSAAMGPDGTLYVASKSGVYALNPDLTLKWSYKVNSIKGTLIYLYNPDGTVKWNYKFDGLVGSPVIGANGNLYVGLADGIFYAFNDKAPVFTAEHISGTMATIQFVDLTVGNITAWKWDFGDSTTSNKRNPTHDYSKSGKYTVTLTLTLSDGSKQIGNKIITVIKRTDITLPEATISPTAEIFDKVQIVTIKAKDNGDGKVEIYYTMDGSDPRYSSTRKLYTNPLEIWDTVTFKYAAIDDSQNWSPVYTKNYYFLDVVHVQAASYYTNGKLNDQIQAIIDSAEPGSTIAFLGQTYQNLHLTINKKLNIISQVGTTIYSSNDVFTVNGHYASGTKITGFTIITDKSVGIVIDKADNVTIYNNQLTSKDWTAIDVRGSSDTTIKYNSITGSYTGLRVYNSEYTQIFGDIITGNQIGISVENSENTMISQLEVLNNDLFGIRIYNSSNASVKGVTITGNGKGDSGAGILIQYSDGVEISGNQINNNWHGIATMDIQDVTIKGNTIFDNDRNGIILSGTTDKTIILSNIIKRNDNGIMIDGRPIGLTIQGNIIVDHTRKSGEGSNTGNGISFGHNSVNVPVVQILHNIIINNARFDIETNAGNPPDYIIGSNWYEKVCIGWEDRYDAKLQLISSKVGDDNSGIGTYIVQIYDPTTGAFVTELPSDLVIALFGPYTQSIMMENGLATLQIQYEASSGTIKYSFYGMTASSTWTNKEVADSDGDFRDKEGLIYVDDSDDNGFEGDSGNGGDGSGDGTGPGGSGGGTGNGNSGDGTGPGGSGEGTGNGNSGDNANGNNNGDGSINNSGKSSGNGVSTGTSPTVGITAPVAAAAAATPASPDEESTPSSSAGKQSSSDQSGSSRIGKTIQELIVDETNKPEIWGIIGVVLLIVLVIGSYYRTDLMKMIRKSRE